MEKKTVNELLALMKAVRSRLSSLNQLKYESVATERRMFGGGEEIIKEPKYDLVKVDVKIMNLENFLFEADAAIKQSNAKTKVNLEVDVADLLKPLQDLD